MAHQHSVRCRDGRRRSFILYFINDKLVLKHKSPYVEGYDRGYDHRTRIFDVYYLDGSIHQKRQLMAHWCSSEGAIVNEPVREVRYPAKRNVLKILNIPKGLRIERTYKYQPKPAVEV